MKIKNNISMEINEEWKKNNKKYLNEIQKFLDKAGNIENEELRRDIIIQMLKCDEELTKAEEAKFKSYEQEKRC